MRTIIEYLSGLTVSQGRLAGQPFTVLPWQGRFVRGTFRPGTQSAALSVARGNGKTALLSGIAAATLDGPLAVSRGETVIVASSFEQARIAFEHVVAFMGDKLADGHRWRVWDTAQQARVEDKLTGARVRCIGSDPRRAHGLAPVLVLADEPAQWPETTGERMVAALRTAAGKQPFSRFVALGTRPADAEHWFAKMLAGSADYAQTHAARPDDPKFQRRTWAKANPSMAHMPDLEAAIRAEAKQARADPALLASFEALRLNLGTEDAAVSTLLDAGLWRVIEGEAATGGGAVWGIDLGTSAGAVGYRGLLASDGRAGLPSGLPCGADPCRARIAGRRGLALCRVRTAWRAADLGPAYGRRDRAATGGARQVRQAVPDRRRPLARGRLARGPGTRRGCRWRRSNSGAWDTAMAPKMSASSAGPARIAGSRRHRPCSCARRWLRQGRSPIQPAITNSARAHKAGAGSGPATMPRRRQSWRSRLVCALRWRRCAGGVIEEWQGERVPAIGRVSNGA